MAPSKRKSCSQNTSGQHAKSVELDKRFKKVDVERLICKKKLDALEEVESLSTDDRFNLAERQRLIEAYNQHGFHVFQDTKLLHQLFPNRRETDLKGMVQRLASGLQIVEHKEDSLRDWQKLCQNLMGNFARDKKINLEDALADGLLMAADEWELRERKESTDGDNDDLNKPNNPNLLRSFAQLLQGKFPDNMTAGNAKASAILFDHIKELVNSMDMRAPTSYFEDGAWLKSTTHERLERQEAANKGLAEFEKMAKKCPSLLDIEKNRNIEALCLELPKIRRITEVLNPLHINESFASSLMSL